MSIKLCVHSEKGSSETLGILKHVLGCDILLRTRAFDFHRRSRESAEDDECSGIPQTYRYAENIEKVCAAVLKNELQTIAAE
ncbi:hypothetical protein TNCV_4887401 [Trichonephila clavipes]|nr:hypothetical protein TNCV_4887401 [Trichonephila clavipes]